MKRGQVSIFIILGILILVSIMFLFFIVGSAQREQLQVAEEDVMTKIFQKEGLRIYVEDCLTDNLEDGLKLIGSQGRIWRGQEGSALDFLKDNNGIEFLGVNGYNKLFYGITYQEDEVFPDSYPCSDETFDNPDYCQYSYPEKENFGTKEKLTKNAIEKDLKNYLINRTVSCVEEFLESEFLIAANIVDDELELDLNIKNEGIQISAVYPMEMVVEGETYFHLTNFDFFYTTEFSSLISSAIRSPLKKELENMDYHYSKEELELSGTYRGLSPVLNKFNVSNGDTVVQFLLGNGIILKNEDYLFQFAIQNRPPALDFIKRDECGIYDYLVLPGSLDDYGKIDFILSAFDPDDDIITYTLEENGFYNTFNSLGLEDFEFEQDSDGNWFFYADAKSLDPASDFVPGIYNLTFNVTDEHGLSDWQTVRFLMDEPTKVNLSLRTPYQNYTETIDFWVSLEDPVILDTEVPRRSVGGDTIADQSLSLSYYKDDILVEPTIDIPITGSSNFCASLPNKLDHTTRASCSFDDYMYDINTWDSFSDPANYVSLFKETTNNGRLDLDFSADYCGGFELSESDSVYFKVKECLPVTNPEYPWAYPYNMEKYGLDTFGNTNYGDPQPDESINPFFSTHSCCNADGSIKGAGAECYRSQPGCYGDISEWTSLLDKSYVLEQTIDYCGGTRGNICGSDIMLKGHEFYDSDNDGASELRCGYNAYDSCEGIKNECQGQLAWGFVQLLNHEGNPVISPSGKPMKGWCNGDMGCTDLCTDAVVYLGDGLPPMGTEGINQKAFFNEAINNEFAYKDPSFQFACGCGRYPESTPCDSNFDGNFNGQCDGGGNCFNDI